MMARRPRSTRSAWNLRAALLLLAGLVPGQSLVAHELQEAAATVIVRDARHAELRLTLPWADLLHQRLMPTRSRTDVLQRLTSGPTGPLTTAIAVLRREVEASVRLQLDGRPPMAFTRWRWPSEETIRAALRTELMARLAGDAETHPARLVTTSEVIASDLPSARIVFGRVLGPVLLTVQRPREEWVAPDRPSTPLCPRVDGREACR